MTVSAPKLLDRLRAELPRVERRELGWILVGAALACLIHARFMMPGFGEQDAARLALDAVHWRAEHAIYLEAVDYRLRTSPLYIHLLKLALDHGLAVAALPRLMNGASVLFSTVCSLALYFLFRRFSTRHIAAAAVVIYALTPCFWLGSIYGMPTMPALACWVLALLAFARASDEPELGAAKTVLYLGLSALFTWLAIALKADMALSAGGFLCVLLFKDRFRPAFFALAVVMVVAAAGATFAYANHLASPSVAPVVPVDDSESTANLHGFVQNWNHRFPFSWDNLIDSRNNAPITHAAGTLLFAIILLALLHGVVSDPKRRRETWALAAWGLPPMLFWGLKTGNSARHNLPALAPLILLAAGLLFLLSEQRLLRAWALIGLLLCASLLDETGAGSVWPKVNPLTSAKQVTGSTSALHERAREFAARPSSKKALIESNYLVAYSEFELWAAAHSPKFAQGHPHGIVDGQREARVHLTGNARSARALAQELRKSGWDVFSLQFDL